MSKKIAKKIKLVIPGGGATPAPPVGSMLGQAGVAIQDFCKAFNDKTADQKGKLLPTKITVYEDKSFDFYYTQPAASILIKEAISLKKGSGKSHIDKVGTISESKLKEIYKVKAPDLNANDEDAGVKILAGTCRSMGVVVEMGK